MNGGPMEEKRKRHQAAAVIRRSWCFMHLAANWLASRRNGDVLKGFDLARNPADGSGSDMNAAWKPPFGLKPSKVRAAPRDAGGGEFFES